MKQELPIGIKFMRGPGNKKYTAIMPDGAKVHFGDTRYEQFEDRVPRALGGKLWSNKNHLDLERRDLYRRRHANIKNKDGKRSIDVLYSPAWFSYHFLW